MQRSLWRQASGYIAQSRRRVAWTKVVSVLACVVVFCTTYALILPALTLEQARTLDCTYETLGVHQHTDGCYNAEGNLICGYADFVIHTHDESCYDADGNLVCALPEIAAHTHTASCFEESSVLTCGQEESEGHVHTDECYQDVYDEDGNLTGRELICGQEASEGHTHTDACYSLQLTQICGQEEIKLHTHDESCYDAEGNLICGQLEIVEHVHTDECFVAVEESAPAVYTYEDETISVQVTLAENSAVPQDAELVVRPITGADTYGEDGSYEDLVRQAEEAVDRTVTEILLYDISFYTAGGDYLLVEDTATVSIQFQESVLPAGADEIAVLHYAEDGNPAVLDAVGVERDENDTPAALTFQTEGFSVFAVVTVTDGNYQRITDVRNLAGQSVAILSNGAKYAMTAEATSDGNGCEAELVASTADLSSYTIWTFEQNTDGTYYISSNGSYLVMGHQTLATEATKDNATAFTITITNGLAEISASVSGNKYYVNLFGGENNPSGFKSYTSSADNLQQLYVKKEEQAEDGVPFTGLDGKSYAIVNLNGNSAYAMTATAGTNSAETAKGLTNVPVSLVSDASSGTTYVSGGDVPVWTFKAVAGRPGVYYIQSPDGKYLKINALNNVTTSDTQQEITVTAGTGNYAGQVQLSSGNYAINWFGTNGQIFSAYNTSATDLNNYQTLCEPLDASAGELVYDLGVTATYVDTHVFSGSWASSAPALTDGEGNQVTGVTQVVTADGSVLYSPGTPGGDYEYFTTRAVDKRQAIGEKLGVDGKEFRFDGWAATVEDENGAQVEYHFAANAQAVLGENGIHITDEEDVERVLPAGTMLTARWTEVSDIVMFFVNYTGTILDTEGNVSGRNQKDFTGIIGIGRVYYGKEQAGTDSVFGNDANGSIRLKFVNEFDTDDPETQIVMKYVTAYDENVSENSTADDSRANGKGYDLYQPANGINDTELETALLRFIQANENVTIKVSTADNANNPEIENENSTPDNYSVRWYVMKEQSDGWHIDGVMVAKTQEVAVAKTFSGLTDDQVKGLLSEDSGGFSMPVQLGEGHQGYITMTTQSIDGQYEYLGQESTGSQSYDWTLHAITDEQYTLSEENYELDNYDVSAVVVHYYRDENGQLQIAYQAGSTTEGLDVLGGKTVGVSFNNFYTKTGTGAFAIHKSANDRTGQSDVGSALQGATFTLYSDANCVASVSTSTTNTRGSAYFNNLEVGTYYLQETDPPTGYLADKSVWKVVVENTGTDTTNIKVTVSKYKDATGNEVTDAGTVCYDGGIAASYEIHNTPTASTVRVTKTFSGLTIEQLNALVSTSAGENSDGYYIEVSPENADETVSPDADVAARLYLQQSTRSQDGWTFTWVISGLEMTDSNGDPILYNIVEYNYFIYSADDSLAYKDVATTAAVNGTAQTVKVNRSTDDSGRKCAEATVGPVEFHTSQSDLVELTNHYTNTFDLTLQKVDAATGAALPKAVFDIYGPYRESTDSSKRISYMDPETGGTKTAYYISTITADEKGIATKTGLSLSEDGSTTFVYVINESFSPDGYAKLDEPIVQTVTVDTNGYAHGVYTADVPNTKEEDYVHTALDTEKVWDPNPPTGVTVTLELYRVTHGERNVALGEGVDAELVAQVTLNGTRDETQTTATGDAITAYESAPWTATWTNLYSASKDYGTNGNKDHYHYFVREVTVNGYATSYTCLDKNGNEPDGAFQTLQITKEDGTETFQGVLLADMDEAYTVTVVNTASYELPAAGGVGVFPYTIGGTLLTAGCLLCGYFLRRKRERRSAR